MGTVTPNIGIYLPANGETNYNDSFDAGMINIDQHDHSGGPNKGVAIGTTALVDNSVTYKKLANDVVDVTTGLGFNPLKPNQIVLQDPLKSIFTLANLPSVGFLVLNGTVPAVRTFVDSATVKWSAGADGSANPVANVAIGGLSPIVVANGGTGVTSLTPYALMTGGTAATTPVQQVASLGNAGQTLTSAGAGALPVWGNQMFYASKTITAAQFKLLSGTPIQIVAAPGAGNVLVPIFCYALLTYNSVQYTSGGGAQVSVLYSGSDYAMQFNPAVFNSNDNTYAFAYPTVLNTSGILTANMSNSPLFIGNNGANFAAGDSPVKFSIGYTVIAL